MHIFFFISVFVVNNCIKNQFSICRGHEDEILDVAFDYTGHHLATASADGTVRVYSSITQNCVTKLEGHDGEVSKVSCEHLPSLYLPAYLLMKIG